jgi:hypothetical protein
MLENGTHATIAEIAAAEKINESYVGRVLRLTLLAPDIVEAILGGQPLVSLPLEKLLRGFPIDWQEQVAHLLTQDGQNRRTTWVKRTVPLVC